jgi:DNA-binding GntR family transcriptional regulator
LDISVKRKRVRGEGSLTVYNTLHQEILTFDLKPSALLDEKSLAERFQMSRSPIREALIKLAGEGLVVTLSNRSTLVAPIDLNMLPKYIEALDILQRANTRLAAHYRTEEDITEIRILMAAFDAAVTENNYLKMSQTNLDFHMAIATAGKNPYLAQQYRTILSEGRRMMHMHFDYLTVATDETLLTDEHTGMLDAIIAQDAEKSDALAHAHTRQFRDRFIRYLQENLISDMELSL